MLKNLSKKKKKNQAVTLLITPHVSKNTRRRVDECGNWVEMLADENKDKLKVHQANFCKNRFCPVCAWRQAEKDALKIGVIMDYLANEFGYVFIMVTLTAPNVTGETLPGKITQYNQAFKNLCKREEIMCLNRGYVRKLEVTYNPERDDYHPHFHCIFAVNKSYFTDRTYVSQEKWLNLWRDVMNDQSITQVDVRRIKMVAADGELGNKNRAVNEVSKYAAKDSDYTLNKGVFDIFYRALKGRQILTFNGAFKEANAMFKVGALDKYITQDNTKYFFLLLYHWGNGEYIEKSCRLLNED